MFDLQKWNYVTEFYILMTACCKVVCVFYWSVVAAVSMLTTVLQSTAFKDWCTRVKKGGKSFHLSCLFTHTVTHKPL